VYKAGTNQVFYHCSAHELTVTQEKGVKSSLTALFEFEIFYCRKLTRAFEIYSLPGDVFFSFYFLPFCYTSAVIPDLGLGVFLWRVGRSPGEGGKADVITGNALKNRVAFPLVCELVREVGVLVLTTVLEQQEGGVTGRWTVLHGFKQSSELHSHHNRNN